MSRRKARVSNSGRRLIERAIACGYGPNEEMGPSAFVRSRKNRKVRGAR